MTGPLSGVTVLDLSRVMAGPWAGQILADLGARVVKVERPGIGDETRSWGPPYLATEDDGRPGASAYFLSVNRGKRSVEIDLSTASGQEDVRRLARESDILLENFRPGTLARFGLGYPELSRENPRLIYCSITGFGQSGPRRSNVAYDFMIQAMSGLMSVTGPPDDSPGGGPQKVGVPVVDIMTGMYAAVGVLAALERQRRTGHGDYIDLAMLDVATGMLANQAMNYLVGEREPKRHGNKHPNIQPQDVYRCADGHLVLAVGNDEQFRRLCDALGMAELAGADSFRTNADRVRNLPELDEILAREFATKPLAHWLEELARRDVPCGPINTIPMAFEEAQLRHRGMIRTLRRDNGADVPQVVSPLRFEQAPLTFRVPPPELGEHTEEVLGELR
ncbi:CaiB/BaiF CoA transferase family protein [Plantactinospora solaniradicis]|uniref:CaiB/BaiF CoA transferase family protein n=1 Tax=Plantactinospora solaniradicis TaxID=1723736 RepID=A0ABW1KE67_9ACTN